MAGIDRTRTFLPPSLGISFFRARMGRYVLVTNSSRICLRKLSAPLSSMASNVTPSIPTPPKCLAASVYCDAPCCLRPKSEGSAFGLQYFRGHMGSLALRPGDSLAILVDGLVNKLQDFQLLG